MKQIATAVDMPSAGNFRLYQALLFYRSTGGHAYYSTPPVVVTLHNVLGTKDGRPVITEGSDVTNGFLEGLHEVMTPKRNGSKILPSNILSFGASHLVWHKPSHREAIYFKTRLRERKLDGQVVSHPHLLFAATPDNLRVFALRHPSKRPEERTILHFAPYFNLNTEGKMCFGGVSRPDSLHPSAIADWEKVFFESRFTHDNYHRRFTAFRGGHSALWRYCLGRTFPTRSLLRAGLTFDNLLRALPSS